MKRYTPTRHTNLVLARNGIYYLSAKVAGRRVIKNLKTRIENVALMRRDEKLQVARSGAGLLNQKATFSAIAAIWLERFKLRKDREPRTKDYRAETLEMIEQTVPDVINTVMHTVTEKQAKQWMEVIKSQYSVSRYNGMLQTFRAVWRLAIDEGAAERNPFSNLKGLRQKRNKFIPPAPDRIRELIAQLQKFKNGKKALLTVRFLMASGLRIGEGREIFPAHIRKDLNEIHLTFKTKNGQFRVIPIFPELQEVLDDLLEVYPGRGPLLPIKNPRNALEGACERAGLPRLTNHMLRHIFASYSIMSGVDPVTVGEWLGHSDRGVTVMQTYAHLMNEHSQRMAKRVAITTRTSNIHVIETTKAA